VPACQSITKKAIVERLQRTYKQASFDETGAPYKIEVSLLKDVATIRIDTSGSGLHRRGYRKLNATAPLRETLAAALVLLSRWDAHRPFVDPMCGSGTIAIEAALYGLRRAPGLLRAFAAEDWPSLASDVFTSARNEAQDLERNVPLDITASDHDAEVLELARRHVQYARLDRVIHIEQADARRFQPEETYGCIISNPPYGERLMTVRETELLYKQIGQTFRKLNTWSVFLLTSHPNFERLYGARADKRRKLYNGRIETQLYQFLGPLPPRTPQKSK
jgi:putative N6-adenine-specific DNA methylase